MKIKSQLILACLTAASHTAMAEPVWYGNLNLNINHQNNFNPDPNISDMYMDSNYSYLGLSGTEKVKSNNNFAKNLSYKIEYRLDINDKESPLKLYQAIGAIETQLGVISLGHQNPIQRDILLKPMDVFSASRVIALEETGYVQDVIDNTVRLDTKFVGMHLSASFSMDNNDPESEDIDSFSVGLRSKSRNSQYGIVYWESNNFSEAERVGYWGANASVNYDVWALSFSYVKPSTGSLPESTDLALVVKVADGFSAKTKHGSLIGEWNSYGAGIEKKMTKESNWYAEYQSKQFDDSNIKNQSLFSLGINYDF